MKVNKMTETYQEEWKYTWKKSKAKWMEIEAYDSFTDLLPPEYFPKNFLIYIINEKQTYRADHKRTLRYTGKI